MSTLTTENPVHQAIGHKYVVVKMENNPYQNRAVAAEDVTGEIAELTAGLRPWLLGYLRRTSPDNGWYAGCLVDTDEDGYYDTYHSLAVEDVVWYWEEEYAPLSQRANGS